MPNPIEGPKLEVFLSSFSDLPVGHGVRCVSRTCTQPSLPQLAAHVSPEFRILYSCWINPIFLVLLCIWMLNVVFKIILIRSFED